MRGLRRLERAGSVVGGSVLVLALAVPAAPAIAAKEPAREDLTNFLLGPGYSQWLVGAVHRIATPAERQAYLALTDDEAAAEFIEAFWEDRRNPDSPWPADQPRAVFERRAEEADRLYSEGTRLGRYSDRGALHILYGPPAETAFEIPRRGPNRGTIEVWIYPKDASPGLDGEPPRRRYEFVERDGVTVRR